VLGTAGLAALVVSPVAAPVALLGMVVARRWPWLGHALPVGAVAVATAAVTALQLGHAYPASFVWPTRFPWTHQPVLVALVVLLGLGLAPDGPGADEAPPPRR
jgi:hypothetical protein